MVSDFSALVSFLERNERLILTTHESPDGDGIGAELALCRALRSLGKRVVVLNSDPTPDRFRFLDAERTAGTIDESAPLLDDLGGWALLILDTNDERGLGLVTERVLPRVRERFVVDHHEGEAANGLIDSDASATCEIVYRLLVAMKAPIDLPTSTALFAGIVFDTGSFAYPKTTAETFAVAHDLVRRGVVPNSVFSRIYESNSVPSLLLLSRVYASLELYFGNRVAVQYMGKEMISECGASYEEADEVVNFPLRSERVKVSVFFKERPDGLLRCSLRSKGGVDVSEIATAFGGGGHKTAAGFKCVYPLEQMKLKVLDTLTVYFD